MNEAHQFVLVGSPHGLSLDKNQLAYFLHANALPVVRLIARHLIQLLGESHFLLLGQAQNVTPTQINEHMPAGAFGYNQRPRVSQATSLIASMTCPQRLDAAILRSLRQDTVTPDV